MSKYDKYIEDLKKDVTHTLICSNSYCYDNCFCIFYLLIIFIILPIIITKFSGECIAICLPLLIFDLIIIFLIRRNHYEKITVAYNRYYNRVKVFKIDGFNSNRKILDI